MVGETGERLKEGLIKEKEEGNETVNLCIKDWGTMEKRATDLLR